MCRNFRFPAALIHRYVVLSLILFAASFQISASFAQIALPQGVSPELLQQLERNSRGSGPVPIPSELNRVREQGRSFQSPEIQPDLDSEDSSIERFYQTKAAALGGQGDLRQFGYRIFQSGTSEGLLNGAVSDGYQLGIGDKLIFAFRGPESYDVEAEVDREGYVVLENMRPIVAAGRTFAEFRDVFRSEVARTFVGMDAYVSLGALRAISVLVLGEVREPGQKQLTSMSTILDALQSSRGILKSGSLRNVTLTRGDKQHRLDLYELIQKGNFSGDIRLKDGDRISATSIGGTFAINGLVNRPGIYELPPGKDAIGFQAALAIAGGAIEPEGAMFVQTTVDENGRSYILETDPAKGQVRAGDFIQARKGSQGIAGAVTLTGHVANTGTRSVYTAPTIAHLIPSLSVLGETPYTGLVILRRASANNFTPTYHSINLGKILRREVNYKLASEDRLIVLGQEDVAFLNSLDVQNAIAGKPLSGLTDSATGIQLNQSRERDQFRATDERENGARARLRNTDSQQRDLLDDTDFAEAEAEKKFVSTQCQGLIELVRIRSTERAGRFANAVRGVHTQDEEITAPKLPCPEIFREEYGDLLPFLLEHSVEIAGEVRRPGIYPVAEDMSLEGLIAVAGGFSREADPARIEINRFVSDSANGAGGGIRQIIDLAKTAAAAIPVLPADRIQVQAKFTNRDNGPVLLAGEFRYPGVYDISRGTRLSEVIRRAGGVTESAYPYGAIFTRESARNDERQALKRYRQEIHDALTFGVTRGGDRGKAIADAAPFLTELVTETEKAVPIGRIVVESDPTVLEIRPDLDPILQPGDQLFMPKRPSTVAVTGEVLNAGSFQFTSGAPAKSYIDKAGGFQFAADKSKSFIVFPDGTARGLQFSAWRRDEVPVPPGSTIIVPRNIAPLDFLTVLPQLTTVLGQLALTTAALNSIDN